MLHGYWEEPAGPADSVERTLEARTMHAAPSSRPPTVVRMPWVHPQEDDLLLFAQGTLDAKRSADVERHVSCCRICGASLIDAHMLCQALRTLSLAV